MNLKLRHHVHSAHSLQTQSNPDHDNLNSLNIDQKLKVFMINIKKFKNSITHTSIVF